MSLGRALSPHLFQWQLAIGLILSGFDRMSLHQHLRSYALLSRSHTTSRYHSSAKRELKCLLTSSIALLQRTDKLSCKHNSGHSHDGQGLIPLTKLPGHILKK